MAVAADDHVDARHGLGQAHVIAVGEAPVLSFLHTTVAETDDHIDILRLAEDLHHLLRGLDGVGERNSARAIGVKGSLFAEHPKDAEANATAFDHDVAADHSIPGQVLEIGKRGIVLRKVGV
jgi:hypothetical protein